VVAGLPNSWIRLCSEARISRSCIKSKISSEWQTVFTPLFQCFAKMFDFKVISSHTVLRKKTFQCCRSQLVKTAAPQLLSFLSCYKNTNCWLNLTNKSLDEEQSRTKWIIKTKIIEKMKYRAKTSRIASSIWYDYNYQIASKYMRNFIFNFYNYKSINKINCTNNSKKRIRKNTTSPQWANRVLKNHLQNWLYSHWNLF